MWKIVWSHWRAWTICLLRNLVVAGNSFSRNIRCLCYVFVFISLFFQVSYHLAFSTSFLSQTSKASNLLLIYIFDIFISSTPDEHMCAVMTVVIVSDLLHIQYLLCWANYTDLDWFIARWFIQIRSQIYCISSQPLWPFANHCLYCTTDQFNLSYNVMAW